MIIAIIAVLAYQIHNLLLIESRASLLVSCRQEDVNKVQTTLLWHSLLCNQLSSLRDASLTESSYKLAVLVEGPPV